jgi:hypothetical protein
MLDFTTLVYFGGRACGSFLCVKIDFAKLFLKMCKSTRFINRSTRAAVATMLL